MKAPPGRLPSYRGLVGGVGPAGARSPQWIPGGGSLTGASARAISPALPAPGGLEGP